MTIEFFYEQSTDWQKRNGYHNGSNLIKVINPVITSAIYRDFRKHQGDIVDIETIRGFKVYFPLYTHDELWASGD